jgi:hypothetical protein
MQQTGRISEFEAAERLEDIIDEAVEDTKKQEVQMKA